MEEKIYSIGGRDFKLKKEFTLDDWDKTKKIDAFFGRMNFNEVNKELFNDITKEKFIDLLWCVLVPVDGGEVNKEVFNTVSIQQGLEIFCDFFFVYLKLSVDTGKILQNLENNAKELMQKSAQPSKN